ncbi:hypothetical protein BH20CHL2_BH20CHL2_03290 [soil metagenome]
MCPERLRSGAETSLRSAQARREVLTDEGGTGGDEVGRCTLEHVPAAVVVGARAEVDDPVG